MAKNKKINGKGLLYLIILLVVATLYYLYRSESNKFIRYFLEQQIYTYLIAAFVIIIHILYFYFSSSKEYNLRPMITPLFGDFFDIVLGGIGISVAITSCLTLIKGFYIQMVYSDKIFFTEFNLIDQWTIFMTMLFLLYFLVTRVIKIAEDILWITKTEKVE